MPYGYCCNVYRVQMTCLAEEGGVIRLNYKSYCSCPRQLLESEEMKIGTQLLQ